MSRHGAVRQFVCYSWVSGVALGFDLISFVALGKHGLSALPAGVIGYMTGLMVHYALSSRFVFDTAAARKPESRLFVEFVLSGLVGLLMTACTIALMTDLAKATPLVAKGAATVLSFIAVFVLRRSVVFKPRNAQLKIARP
jgi:putative flippase GtrA